MPTEPSLPNPLPLPGLRAPWLPILAMLFVGVIYGTIACTAESELGATDSRDAYYNLMLRGWLQGKVSLATDAPAGLKALPDPYDPVDNALYRGATYYGPRIHDLSYYNGKLYAYFSAVPAVVAFLPFRILTGGWLSHQGACFGFCLAGFIAATALLWSLRNRFFSGTGDLALAVAVVAVGFLMASPLVLQRPDVWEVPITCAHACWMLALLAVGLSLLQPRRQIALGLLAAASAALAIGSRPSTAFCALILFLPAVEVMWGRNGFSRFRKIMVVATFALPFAVVGAGLLAFNQARFGSWLEFGQRYQLNSEVQRNESARYFRLAYVPYNVKVYFFSTYKLTPRFPFVGSADASAAPVGHAGKDHPFGLVSHYPALLFALVLLIPLRRFWAPERRPLRLLAGAIAWSGVATLVPLLLFFGACVRYEFEFTAPLAILAGLGFLSLESLTGGPWRRALRGLWAVSLVVSVSFCLLLAARLRAQRLVVYSGFDEQKGQRARAINHLETALLLDPYLTESRAELGRLLVATSNVEAAARHYARLVREVPDSAILHFNYGYTLLRLGRAAEAVTALTRSLEMQPGSAATEALLAEARKNVATPK